MSLELRNDFKLTTYFNAESDLKRVLQEKDIDKICQIIFEKSIKGLNLDAPLPKDSNPMFHLASDLTLPEYLYHLNDKEALKCLFNHYPKFTYFSLLRSIINNLKSLKEIEDLNPVFYSDGYQLNLLIDIGGKIEHISRGDESYRIIRQCLPESNLPHLKSVNFFGVNAGSRHFFSNILVNKKNIQFGLYPETPGAFRAFFKNKGKIKYEPYLTQKFFYFIIRKKKTLQIFNHLETLKQKNINPYRIIGHNCVDFSLSIFDLFLPKHDFSKYLSKTHSLNNIYNPLETRLAIYFLTDLYEFFDSITSYLKKETSTSKSLDIANPNMLATTYPSENTPKDSFIPDSFDISSLFPFLKKGTNSRNSVINLKRANRSKNNPKDSFIPDSFNSSSLFPFLEKGANSKTFRKTSVINLRRANRSENKPKDSFIPDSFDSSSLFPFLEKGANSKTFRKTSVINLRRANRSENKPKDSSIPDSSSLFPFLEKIPNSKTVRKTSVINLERAHQPPPFDKDSFIPDSLKIPDSFQGSFPSFSVDSTELPTYEKCPLIESYAIHQSKYNDSINKGTTTTYLILFFLSKLLKRTLFRT